MVQFRPITIWSGIGAIKALSAEPAKIRGPAFYGYEAEDVAASDAFTKDYATETLEGTRMIANLLRHFILSRMQSFLRGQA